MLFSLTNPEIAILMMGIFLFAVLLGFPIAFTLMAMGVGFGYYAYFDPTKMEAITAIPPTEEFPANTVIEEIESGYLYKDRVLMPAKVVVASEQ